VTDAPDKRRTDGRRRARRRLFALVVVGLGSLLAAGLLELVFTRVYPVYSLIQLPDPELLWLPIPNARRVNFLPAGDGGAAVRLEFDAGGYRGPGLDPTHALPRVLVLGDSFVMGAFSPREETFAVRLGEACAARGRPVEVVNAGVVGFGPDQAVLRLEREVAALRPDVVVLGFFSGNDFGDPIRNKLVGFAPDGTFSERAHVLDPAAAEAFAWAPVVVHAARRLRASLAPEPPPAYTIEGELALRLSEWRSYEQNGVVTNLFGDTFDVDVWLDPDAPGGPLKRRLAATILGWLRRTCEQAGCRPLVVAIPTDQALRDRPFGPIDPTRYPRYRKSGATDAVVEAATAAGVPVVDLFPPFSAAREPLYFDVDGHWNARGQALAADAVVGRLLELLPR